MGRWEPTGRRCRALGSQQAPGLPERRADRSDRPTSGSHLVTADRGDFEIPSRVLRRPAFVAQPARTPLAAPE